MIQENLNTITRLRHTLHQHPELSMEETGTMETLQTFLRKTTSLEIHSREGWFYAYKAGRGIHKKTGGWQGTPDRQSDSPDQSSYIRPDISAGPGRPGPIAFRADMDALPIPETISLPYGSQNEGVSHKCGHDGHCAALCGLALELDRCKADRDVYLIFQPGEETGAGAVRCAELIREKGISEIYAFHNLGGYPEGSVVYREGLTQPASEGLRIRLTGKTSHASAPERGNNPAGAIAEIVQYALTLNVGTAREKTEIFRDSPLPDEISDRKDTKKAVKTKKASTYAGQSAPMRLCTITGIRLGDGDFGISPGEGEICMTLRAEVEAEMLAMEKAVLACAEKVSEAAGLRMTHSIHDYFPETRNHDACLQRVLETARANKIPAVSMQELWRASEDFGHYLKVCPGAMFYIGNGENYPPLHTFEYDFNDRILKTAVDMFRELAGISQNQLL